jgi:hypothetical protein
MFSALLAIVTWAVGHEDLIATAWKDVSALLGRHVSTPPSVEAQVALQAGIAAAAAQLHAGVTARLVAQGLPQPAAVVVPPAHLAPPAPAHVDLEGNGP